MNPPILQLQNVSYTYQGDTPALYHADFFYNSRKQGYPSPRGTTSATILISSPMGCARICRRLQA